MGEHLLDRQQLLREVHARDEPEFVAADVEDQPSENQVRSAKAFLYRRVVLPPSSASSGHAGQSPETAAAAFEHLRVSRRTG